jgi:dihydrofolate synthase/folylpolyglutamate synthase
VEIAIIEVGLGGRLDATNVLSPLLTITTDISYDHMDVLGHTLERIAAEKGGIIKPGVPHLTGLLPEAAQSVISRICTAQGAPLFRVDPDRLSMSPDRSALDYRTEGLTVRHLKPALLGEHQLRNTALALEAVSIMRDRGVRLPLSAVREGIATTQWRGRFQMIARKGRPTIILDVCHNASGAVAFAQTFARRFPGRRVSMIVGFVQKKQHQQMFDALSGVAAEYLLVPLKTRRSIHVDEIITTIDFRGVPVRRCRSLAAAYAAIVKRAGSDDIIPVIGSHYLVGEFLGRYT